MNRGEAVDTIQLEGQVLDLVQEMAEKAIEKHLPNSDWYFEWDRAKRRMGACHYGPKKITMSPTLVLNAKKEQIEDTILHEVAHAMVGSKYGHGAWWRTVALSIGCNGERCHTVSTASGAKYMAPCRGCGHIFYKFRRPRRGLSGYRCNKCKTELFFKNVR